jgi:hypothetical protein
MIAETESSPTEVNAGAAVREAVTLIREAMTARIEAILSDELALRGFPDGTRYDLDRNVWLLPATE